MKIRGIGLVVALAAICTLNTGCVVGRRVIPLDVPAVPAASADKGPITINQVTDERKFENKPAEASTPSIDGDVNKASKEMLETMIGRQRNGFGKAMGDIAIAPPETVVTTVRALVTEGLKSRGYTVGSGSGGPSVDIVIKEFWAWFRPGFAEIAFEAQIETIVSIKSPGKDQTLTVTGHGREEGQMASDEHWQRAYQLAFEDYLKNLDTSLAGAGF